MAQTFIGRLIMGYQDKAGPGAKKTAQQVKSAMRDIEGAGRRLASAPWGVNFQRQLDKIGLSPAQVAEIKGSWNSLNQHIRSNNLNKALARSEISGWKAATLGHFAQIRAGMETTERRARRHRQIMQAALRPAYVALGGYTGAYMGGLALREGFTAGSERRREVFRQDMSSLTEGEKGRIGEVSTDLSQRYKSMSKTDIMELARVSRNLMGDTERGLAVLERMTQGLVTLQSTKGGEVAIREMTGLLRGLDNIGVNKDGQKGVDLVNEMIEAMVRASQIEGQDFDAGSFFSFARRSKVAGPALSPEFLTIAPTIMQDMGPDGAGNALGMAFKAFVLEAVGSAGGKKYLQERDRLGLRDENGVIDSALFGRNPIEWTRKYLVPALVKDGVDMNDDTAIAKAVGKLSGNTNATGLLTRFITQQEQIDRLVGLYNKSMGIEAADRAGTEDPFVAYRGFIESLRDLSAAVLPMESIARGLDTMAGGIKRFAAAIEENPDLGAAVGVGAGAAAGGAVYMMGKAVYGLITAGTNLNVAAVALQRAAATQAGGGLVDGIGKGKGGNAFWRNAGRLLGAAHFAYLVAKMPDQFIDKGSTEGVQARADAIKRREKDKDFHRKLRDRLGLPDWITLDHWRNGKDQFAGRPEERRSQGWREEPTIVVTLADEVMRNSGVLPVPQGRPMPTPASRPTPVHPDQDRYEAPRPPGRTAQSGSMSGTNALYGFDDKTGLPKINTSEAEATAKAAGDKITQALSPTGKPTVDVSAIDHAISRAQQLLSLLQGAGAAADRANAKVSQEVNRTFSDLGATP